jgi:hypothetical protein
MPPLVHCIFRRAQQVQQPPCSADVTGCKQPRPPARARPQARAPPHGNTKRHQAQPELQPLSRSTQVRSCAENEGRRPPQARVQAWARACTRAQPSAVPTRLLTAAHTAGAHANARADAPRTAAPRRSACGAEEARPVAAPPQHSSSETAVWTCSALARRGSSTARSDTRTKHAAHVLVQAPRLAHAGAPGDSTAAHPNMARG